MSAIDCMMSQQMRNTLQDNLSTFMHQIDPHHVNAVKLWPRFLSKARRSYHKGSDEWQIYHNAVGDYQRTECQITYMRGSLTTNTTSLATARDDTDAGTAGQGTVEPPRT
jgi:hypothetical protein